MGALVYYGFCRLDYWVVVVSIYVSNWIGNLAC